MKNIGQLMKQAQQMQQKMAEMQEQLASVEMTGMAGGGMVQLTLNGKGDVKKVKLDKAVVDPAGGRGSGGSARRRVQRRTAEGHRPYRGRDAEADRRPGAARRAETAVLSRPGSLAAPVTRAVRTNARLHCGRRERTLGRLSPQRKPPDGNARRAPHPRPASDGLGAAQRPRDPEAVHPRLRERRQGLRHRIHRQGQGQGRAGIGALQPARSR